MDCSGGCIGHDHNDRGHRARTLLLGLIGAWIVLAVVRVVILVGFAKKFQLCLADLQNSR